MYLQGHAPLVEGRMLSAYLCGGPNTCHESTYLLGWIIAVAVIMVAFLII